MKIITLWQPWALFIACGWKTIETRTHDRFKYLQKEVIGIHAGKTFDKDWEELTSPYLTDDQKRITRENLLWHHGEIICIAKVEIAGWLIPSHSNRALIKCDITDRYGLFLKDIKRIQPIPAKGHQGIWNYEFKEGELVYL
jgi:activating signal cointegrator 1